MVVGLDIKQWKLAEDRGVFSLIKVMIVYFVNFMIFLWFCISLIFKRGYFTVLDFSEFST